MRRKKFAGVSIGFAVVNGAWYATFVVHYRGEVLHHGRVYVASRFPYHADQRATEAALRKAEEWAKQNGFDGVVLRPVA